MRTGARYALCSPGQVSPVIYLDNAATTYPKPPQVYRVWADAIRTYGANPGRAGYDFSSATSEAVYAARESCASLFGAQSENTIFTLNCTHALNLAIKGIAGKKPHYVISDLEHNAVLRPVHSVTLKSGGSYSIFEVSADDRVTLARAERAIRRDTAAVICTAASNVTGRRLPVKGLAEICRRHGVCFVVDGAQGAGALPLQLSDGINILCAAGHKGLYGPMGTGLVVTDGKFPLDTLIEGGTGSASESPLQPEFTPDRFESGTINTAGVIALGTGAQFVRAKTPSAILKHELELCRHFSEEARKIKGLILHNDITQQNYHSYAPVVSFGLIGRHSSEVSDELGKRGFCLRGGLHCAPLAHRKLGTLDIGTVRFSPSVFTTHAEVLALLRELYRMASAHKA